MRRKGLLFKKRGSMCVTEEFLAPENNKREKTPNLRHSSSSWDLLSAVPDGKTNTVDSVAQLRSAGLKHPLPLLLPISTCETQLAQDRRTEMDLMDCAEEHLKSWLSWAKEKFLCFHKNIFFKSHLANCSEKWTSELGLPPSGCRIEWNTLVGR